MAMKNSIWVISGLVLLAGILTFASLPKKTIAPTGNITNFEECVAAGYGATRSYPSQCTTPDNQVFTQNVPPKDQLNNSPSEEINNFEQCAAAGNPIMESFPEQCMTPDGRSFTRELTEEEKKKVQPPSNGTAPDTICADNCGDGTCQEIVCLGSGCPCPESKATCPQDCGKNTESNVESGWQLN